ncbi:MAG TPA: nitrite/sulfite reductase [Chloroflexia bacterium]|nr:nitrite/sulfite reductase [Chloroflexia bacterium]
MPSAQQIEEIKKEGVAVDLPQLAWQGYRALNSDDLYRLKFQGVCSQRAGQSGAEGVFFLRIKIPYGQVRPTQLKMLAHLAAEYGRGWGHLTTRHGLELHSVKLEDVPAIFDKLAEVGLTTKASCGDTIRNVVTCAHVGDSPVASTRRGRKVQNPEGPLFDIRPWALLVQNYFLELGPEKLNLPRKMNVYISGCQNCIGHARINDLGLVATFRQGPDGSLEPGFSLWVGGGLGANPVMAQQLVSFLSFEQTLPALEAVVRLYMDHGNRKSRATSKLKFLVQEWGMGRFSQEFERYYARHEHRFNSRPLPKIPRLKVVSSTTSSRPANLNFKLGQKNEVNVLVPGGEIRAEALEVLADLSAYFGDGYLYLTKEQNVRFKNLEAREAAELTSALVEAGFQTEGAGSLEDVLACPGTTFCPVAATPSLATAERLRWRLHEIIRSGKFEPEVEKLRIHISGCPNSCAQHQVADVGLAGTRVHIRQPGQSGLGYQLFLGGNMEGTGKLAMLVHHGIPDELIEQAILAVLEYYSSEKKPQEEFSSYITRVGQPEWEARLEKIAGVAGIY